MKFLQHSRQITFIKVLIAVFCGIWLWLNRYSMNPDGISYLSVAEAYLNGSSFALNSYWGPAYSWIMAVFLFVIKPSLYWKFPMVQTVNFLIFALTFTSFTFFVESLIDYADSKIKKNEENIYFCIRCFGYVLFAWSMLCCTLVHRVAPDLLLNGVIYLASAILLRIKTAERSYATYIQLGLVLAAGYLCKSVMFILAFCFIGSAFATSANKWRSRLWVSAAVFLLAVSPYIYQISIKEQHFTIGTSGKLNYFWFVQDRDFNKEKTDSNFQIRNVSADTADLPFYYDPDVNEMPRLRLDLKKQGLALLRNLRVYYHICFPIFMPLAALTILMGFSKSIFQKVSALPVLILPNLVGLTLYALVLVEPRYVGVFIVIISLCIFSGFILKKIHNDNKIFELCIISTLLLLLPICLRTAFYFKNTLAFSLVPPYVHTAKVMSVEGLRPGDAIAYLGENPYSQYWAYLAHVQIKVCMPDREGFFKEENRFMESLRKEQIKAIVSDSFSKDYPPPANWYRISDSYSILFLNSN